MFIALCIFQSPFSGDFLCFPHMKGRQAAPRVELSISIFRRLSLFLNHHTFHQNLDLHFQSPFSGDFLCFLADEDGYLIETLSFQSPFSGDFLCFPPGAECWWVVNINFQSPFSGDFLCFQPRRRHSTAWKLMLSISIFRRLSLFLGNGHSKDNYAVCFQSPFSGDFLCFWLSTTTSTTMLHLLSISIFRRLSLFPRSYPASWVLRATRLSISIFRRLSLFHCRNWGRNHGGKELSISIFRRLSLFQLQELYTLLSPHSLSISIFRRLSLFPTLDGLIQQFLISSFNLHFQETFFVSTGVCEALIETIEYFQSPFSGDFLCFSMGIARIATSPFTFNLHFQETFFVSESRRGQKSEKRRLSISIFRRLSLFQIYHTNPFPLRKRKLSISIFRRLSLFRKRFYISIDTLAVLSISIFRRLSLFRRSSLTSAGLG